MPNPNYSFPPPRSPALTAFLNGIEPRAWVFALSQCGDALRADAALESALRDFVARVQSLPLAQWPVQLWTSLLKQPLMLAELDPALDLARLTPGPRAALLLRLIAGLDLVHAAQVLGVSPAAYEVALHNAQAHPDMADAQMQALREHLHDLIHQMPVDRRQALAALREQALSKSPEGLAPVARPKPRAARQRWWLWSLLALLLLALIATFFWPVGSLIAPGQSESLPMESITPLPTLTDTVIITHPDYQQLAEPTDDAIAQQLAFLSWLAAVTSMSTTPDVSPAPATPPESLDALPAAEQVLLSSARAAWPALDPATRAALLRHARDWQSRPSEQRALLRQRVRQWDRQAAPERARRRTPFIAWQGLSAADSQRVRAAARYVAALPPPEQQALRAQFAALPADTQRLWWMGPALGQELVPIASLFAFMPEADRPALLVALRALDAQARTDLALLAPRLSEARRQALRKDLLAAPPAKRAAVIRQRLISP